MLRPQVKATGKEPARENLLMDLIFYVDLNYIIMAAIIPYMNVSVGMCRRR